MFDIIDNVIIEIDVTEPPTRKILIGYQGEHLFRKIKFNVSKWHKYYPNGITTVIINRNDGETYTVVSDDVNDIVEYSPSRTDTSVVGDGRIEVRMFDGDILGKTCAIAVTVDPCLNDPLIPPVDPGGSEDVVTWVSSVNGQTGTVNLSADDVGALPDTTHIPTKTSDLTNDSKFITEQKHNSDLHDVGVVIDETTDHLLDHEQDTDIHITAAERTKWDNKADTADIPTKTSDLTNDSGFLTHLSPQLLWQAGSFSQFAAGTIDVDLSEYSIVLVVFLNSLETNSFSIQFAIKNANIVASSAGYSVVDGISYISANRMMNASDSGIYLNNAVITIASNDARQNNNVLIPYAIYGL